MNKKIIILGITLFSMFFGAGNLIFAPFLGAQAGTSLVPALSGMLISSVVLPVSAICIIAPYGNARTMISRIWKPLGPIFMTLVYLLIGPCIAIPRTASTALEMWNGLIPNQFLQIAAVFLFFLAAWLMASHPGRLKDILGKIMGPVLIVLILFLCIPLLFHNGTAAAASEEFTGSPFLTGLNEGYQTMDILAAFCFGLIILLNIRKLKIQNESSALAMAALIAGILLAVIYTLLAFVSARNSQILQPLTNGAQILSEAARMTYGDFGRILCGLIFLIACLNVCSGLLACCSEYFSEIAPKISYRSWLLIFTAAGFVVACTGLDSILSWSGTLLTWICPAAIVILLIALVRLFIERDRKKRPDTEA